MVAKPKDEVFPTAKSLNNPSPITDAIVLDTSFMQSLTPILHGYTHASYFIGRTQHQIENEIKQLIELYEQGFIQRAEYEIRRSHLIEMLDKRGRIQISNPSYLNRKYLGIAYHMFSLESPQTNTNSNGETKRFIVIDGKKFANVDEMTVSSNLNQTNTNAKKVRIFVSSTFRDMQEERDCILRQKNSL